MPALTTVVAIAVSCAVVFMVTTVVGTIIWVRIRQERLSLAVANARQGRYAHGLQTFPTETLTELSREEGSALRQYGQLPYGRPTEWGLLASRESLTHSNGDSETSSHFAEKARGLRRSFSSSGSKRRSKSLIRPRQSSLGPLRETAEKTPLCVARSSNDVPTSAVEGAFELPTERTPRHTPDREEDKSIVDSTIRPISGPWSGPQQRERPGSLFPLIEDNYEGFEHNRTRGGSITAQSPGMMPEQPVPPPPSAYPPNRFRLSKNDSIRFSSLSLETADSSILDDSRRASAGVESDFTSPALPPCPTFAPYSANDVGRMEYERRSYIPSNPSLAAPYIFPPSSPARVAQRRDPDRTSPRRSMTARSPTHSMERICPSPRRSESLSTNQSRRSAPCVDLDRVPPLNVVGRNSALLPHFSQMQRHSLYTNQRSDHDPFFGGVPSASGYVHHQYAPVRRPNSFSVQESHFQVPNVIPRPPLASAMKGGSGPRKGHRRQNCVRISIHPPITFGGPAFSPMVEEPEELDELDLRRSRVSDLSNISSFHSSLSTLSNRNSFQDIPKDQPRISEVPGDSRPISYGSPSKKRKHARNDSNDSIAGVSSDNDKSLPELLTSLPTTEAELSRTPSPDKLITPTWIVPNYAGSPTTYENLSPGSPRRSAVKGPRNPPGTQRRNSFRLLPLEESANLTTSTSSPPPRAHSMKRESYRKSTGSLQRAMSWATYSPSPSPRHSNDWTSRVNGNSTAAQQQQQQQSPSCGISKTPSTHSTRMVPIWEDQKQEHRHLMPNPTITVVNEPAELQGDIAVSPKQVERSMSHRMSKPEFTTPTKKTVGLGIGAATPASLYDGDGFLREQ